MADSGSEDEKLRQQIAFLTQLIKSASGTSDRESSPHASIVAVSGHDHQISRQNPRKTTGYYRSQGRSVPERHCNHATPADREKSDPSKYSWSRTKFASSVCRKENSVLTDKPSFQSRSHSSVSAEKSFSNYLKAGQTLALKKTATVSGGNIGSLQHADSNRVSSVPKSSSNQQSVKSDNTVSVKQHATGQSSNLNPHQGRAKPSSASNEQVSIQQRLIEAEKTIQDLKKDIQKRASKVGSSTSSCIENKNIKLQSLSPYKLQKVPSTSSFTASSIPVVTHKQNQAMLQEISSKHYQSRTLSIPTVPKSNCDTKPSAIQSALPVIKSKYSLKRVNLAPSSTDTVYSKPQKLSSSHWLHNKPQRKTPSKLVLKTRFALKRERKLSGSKSSSRETASNRSQPTPNKFVRVSQYSIKRVRRSLSDESKKQNQRVMNVSPFDNKNTNTQYAARVIRTKYKVQKVFRGQQHQQQQIWSTTVRGRRSRYGNTGPSMMARQGCHPSFSGRWRQGSGYYVFEQHGTGFQQKHWKFANSRQRGKDWKFANNRQQAFYRGYKQYQSSSRPLPWQQRQLQYQAPGFISQKYVQRRLAQLKRQVPFNPKMKVDRRTPSPQKSLTGGSGVSMVVVNGMLYKSSVRPGPSRTLHHSGRPSHSKDMKWSKIRHARANSMRTISLRGVTFSMGNDGKKLTRVAPASTSTTQASSSSGTNNTKSTVPVMRVDFGGVTYIQTKPGTLERLGSAQTRKMASRVVNRTVAQAAARSHKLVKKQYCMFYNRFGKCNKGASCTYIHDPDKVAVCTRFLRGTCQLKGCPFSHKVSPDKMPVCSYFLKGVCNKDDCPYRHVNVNRDAEVCADFVRGYCPQGDKCKKKHVLVCAEFSRTGKCSEGKKCRLQHRQRKRKSIDKQNDATPAKLRKRTISRSSTDKATRPATENEPTAFKKPIDKKRNDRKIEDREVKDEKLDDRKADKTTDDDKLEQQAQVDDSHLPFKERKLPAYISLNLKKEPKAVATVSSLGSSKPRKAATSESRSPDKDDLVSKFEFPFGGREEIKPTVSMQSGKTPQKWSL